jgi:hypothetical protein
MSTGPRWSFNTYRPWFPGDVNGDGKTDFMMVADSGGNSFLCVAFVNPDGSYSTRTVNSGWPWFGHWRWFPGDLNGDGRTDFLLAADSGPGGTISLIGNLSDGTGASWTPIRHETGWGWETDQRWFAADVTGDGADDFVRIASHSGTDLFACGPHAIILAASLQSTGTLLTMLGETNYGWSGRYWWFPEDADGDGKDDILLAADSGPGNTSGLHTARLRDLPALSSSVGQGCGGGLPKLTSSRPVLGQSLGLQVTGAPASAAGQMLLSARPAGALGLTCQCQAFLDPVTLVFLFPFVTSSGGGASASVPLPAEQTIAGLALRMQALATGGSCGFVLTNGIDLVLGIE